MDCELRMRVICISMLAFQIIGIYQVGNKFHRTVYWIPKYIIVKETSWKSSKCTVYNHHRRHTYPPLPIIIAYNSTESRHLSFNTRSNRHQVEKESSHNLNLASNLIHARFCAMTLDSNLNPLRFPETHYLTV